MKKILQFLILNTFVLNLAYAQSSCYQLAWADEFNGAALDLGKWTPQVGVGSTVSGNAELQYYTARPQNIQVANGSLKIIALAESYGGNAYTSARLQTKNLVDWLYGRIEARIKLPVAQGMWPAFWMLPTESYYGSWPRNGEIDIMELVGLEPSKTYGTIHTHDNGVVKTFSSVYTLPSGTFADDFHVFAMEWSPNEIKFFVDNNLYATKTNLTVSPYPWVFDKRFFMLLNLAIGGPWALAPDATTTFPQVMEVDYVRVYQKLEDMSITGKNLVEPNTNGVIYAVPTLSNSTYQWSISGGGSIVTGQNTPQITVNWANTSGNVSVLISDGCTPSATLSSDVVVSNNLWINPNFERDYVAWDTRPKFNPIVNFNISTTNVAEGAKSACVQVNTVGAQPWDIQLSHTNIDLVAGTNYTLRFKAKADANRTVPIAFIRTSEFGGVVYNSVNLTTTWQDFSMNFTPTSTVNAMFNADLAGAIGTYCFDNFVFGRTIALPISLLNFNGFAEKKGNRLTWAFADIKEVRSLEIQKSEDGLNFIPLSPESVRDFAALNILTKNDRFYTDESPFDLTYYRLKMLDLEGKLTYSKVIALKRGDIEATGQKDFTLFPNPTTQDFTIQFKEETANTLECRDVFGRLIFSKKLDASMQQYSFSAKDLGLSVGTYFLKTDRVGTVAQRFVVLQ
jgi:beta-glucanase (GH16 family)